MMTDPIADMLTRIRNASAVKKAEVILPWSKIKFDIAKLLKHENYVEEVEKVEDHRPSLKIVLKYDQNGKPAITGIKRISKPGRRIYAPKDQLPNVLNNLGIAIISTSRGLMTNKKAKKESLGGEIICEIN